MKKLLTTLLALLFFTGTASVGEVNPDKASTKEPTLNQRIWALVEALYRLNLTLEKHRPIY